MYQRFSSSVGLLQALLLLACSAGLAQMADDTGMPALSAAQMRRLETDPVRAREEPDIKRKLAAILSSSIIDNSASRAGVKPKGANCPGEGPAIRVTSWNIERSLSIKPSLVPALTSDAVFKAGYSKGKPSQKALDQLAQFKESDIIFSQEMMVGNREAGTKNAPRDLARSLGMNYSFAPYAIELAPKGADVKNGPIDPKNPLSYNGHFGTAVFSRYPIKKVTVRELKTLGYDWAAGELKPVTGLEAMRRTGAKVALGVDVHREVKVGGRGIQIVDLDVPGQKNNTITVVNVHLEVRCTPAVREKQMKEILAMIKNIDNPVIMAGDFNATPADVSPTNPGRVAGRALTNSEHYVTAACTLTAPTGVGALRTVANIAKNFNNPMAPDIPGIAPNPQKALFKDIKDYQFDDGGHFDFRGDSNHMVGHSVLWWNRSAGNANQRGAFAGFKTTYKPPTRLVAGFGRLDFMFGKTNSDNKSYKGALVRGEVLEEFNRKGRTEQFSDHSPITSCFLLGESEKTPKPAGSDNVQPKRPNWFQRNILRQKG